MSALPNNTFASPNNPFYAAVGGGGGDSLQSPVDVIPDGQGDVLLNIDATPGGAAIAVLTVKGGATGDGNIVLGGGGREYLLSASGTNGNLTLEASPAQVGQGSVIEYQPGTGILSLGDGLGGGFVETVQPLYVGATPVNGNAVNIASFDAATGTIHNTVAAGGTLKIGASSIYSNTLEISDVPYLGNTNYVRVNGTAGNAPLLLLGSEGGGCGIRADGVPGATTQVLLGADNTNYGSIKLSGANTIIGSAAGSPNVFITGGTPATAASGANIRTDTAAGSSGVLTIGSGVNNPTILYVKDAAASDTGFVDVAGGNVGTALRLQGSNTQVGANAARVSTNNVSSASPILNLNNSVDGTAAIQITSTSIQLNKLVTGYLTLTTPVQAALLDNNSAQIPSSDYGSLGAGLFTILASSVIQGITGQPGIQVSAQGYMSSVTQKWIGGCGFGQALAPPTNNFFITPNALFTGLLYGNVAGFNMNSNYTITFIRLTGDLGL